MLFKHNYDRRASYHIVLSGEMILLLLLTFALPLSHEYNYPFIITHLLGFRFYCFSLAAKRIESIHIFINFRQIVSTILLKFVRILSRFLFFRYDEIMRNET